MKQSKIEMYFHFVWATWQRLPLVTPEIEREVYRCIEQEARRLRCTVLAIGGLPDHVHLAVKVPATTPIPKIMQQAKGVSSTFVRDQLNPGGLFRWQEGYAVFTICPPHVKHIVAYIRNQKQHHADGSLIEEWEETDEEYVPHANKKL
jgi:REP element-mobilizing transposase RayT